MLKAMSSNQIIIFKLSAMDANRIRTCLNCGHRAKYLAKRMILKTRSKRRTRRPEKLEMSVAWVTCEAIIMETRTLSRKFHHFIGPLKKSNLSTTIRTTRSTENKAQKTSSTPLVQSGSFQCSVVI